MPNNIYQSEFTGPQMDERFAAVPGMQAAITEIQAALANRYTKGEVDAMIATLNAMEYVDVASLPDASASTMGKIYLVGPDGSGYYSYYISSYDDTDYSWVGPLGTTEISLANYATKAELSALEQEMIVGDTVPGENILDPSTLTISTKYLARNDGVTEKSNGFGYTDFIPIPPEGLYCNNVLTLGGTYGTKMNYYNASKEFVATNTTSNTATPGTNRVYVRFNLGDPSNFAEGESYAVFRGRVKREYVPYSTSKKVGGDTIKDYTLGFDKLNFTKSRNLVREFYESRYFDGTSSNSYLGTYRTNSSYDASCFIPVVPGKTYASPVTLRYVTLLNSAGEVARNLNEVKYFTPESGEVWVVVTFYATTAKQYMLEEGSVSSGYVPYQPQIEEQYIPNKELPDGSVTADKLAPGVSFPAAPAKFNAFSFSGTAAASGGSVSGDNILLRNVQQLAVEILGTIEDVNVGVGIGGLYGAYLRITATDVSVLYGTGPTVASTAAHGLTLGTHTKVLLSTGPEAKKFWIIDDAGGIYSGDMHTFVGAPKVENNGSAAITVSGRYASRFGDARVWVAGDSYWSQGDAARIPYQLNALGANQFVSIGRGGASATDVLPSIEAMLNTGARPSYILWALGMNGGGDSNGEVNSTWLGKVEDFLDMCSDGGIIPVFLTIPTVPTQAHVAMNEWIRESGYRYIDVAAEVEAEGTTTWRGWGTDSALLSSDEVHPTQAGAKQIAGRIMVDFPEIAQV